MPTHATFKDDFLLITNFLNFEPRAALSLSLSLASLEQQEGGLPYVEIYVVFGLVSNATAELSANKALPDLVALFEVALEVLGHQFLSGVFFHDVFGPLGHLGNMLAYLFRELRVHIGLLYQGLWLYCSVSSSCRVHHPLNIFTKGFYNCS